VKYGYARVSTDEQSLDCQIAALKKAGCEIIREEKASATSREGRPELEALLGFLRQGDVLVITRIDRLARSNADFQAIYADLARRGVALECIEQPIMNTGGALGNLMVSVLAAFAQFETELRKERVREGIDRARRNKEISPKTGRLKYGGRTASIDRDEMKALLDADWPPAKIARKMGIARSSVYRLMGETAA